MRVGPEVLAILDRCTLDGNRLFLPPAQLDRASYVAVNKVIEAAGGKWSKREKAHLFPADPADIIDGIALTGEITTAQDMGFFPTPPEVVARLIGLAELSHGLTVLEPSAGLGAIVNAAQPITGYVAAVEVDENRAAALKSQGVASWVAEADFLTIEAGFVLFDRVVMNPPFAKQQDIDHVTHALGFLKPGGLLVSVMSASTPTRANRKAVEFQKLVAAHGGWFESLPDDAFKASGTGVHTVIVVIPEASA